MSPLFLLLVETPSPAPTEMELWEVTPGIEGFVLGFFVLALACIPLFRSMIKHMRRVDHNQRMLERAEEAGRASAPEASASKHVADPPSGPAKPAGGVDEAGTRPGPVTPPPD